MEKRQEWVLSQLENLKDRVKQLGEKLGVGAGDIYTLPQVRNNGWLLHATQGSIPFTLKSQQCGVVC